jgi:hypothetical protein
MQQQRKDEILAKKAKLAELKRQRELRQKEFSQTRNSVDTNLEVCLHMRLNFSSLYLTRATGLIR